MIWDFVFNLSTRIEFGNGKINEVAKCVKELGGQSVLIVTDKGITKSGITDRVLEILSAEKIHYVVYDEVKPNPRDVDCESAYRLALDEKVDVLIGLGGGSSMDSAKAIGTLITNGGKINNWYGANLLRKPITPLICIPTTSGTGSEVTFFSVITDTTTKQKLSILDIKLAPQIALLDPELTLTVPKSITASTGMDALTHAIEAYTCKIAEPITDGLALFVIDLIVKYLPVAVRDLNDIEARKQMLAASLIAGIAFGNSDVAGVHCMAEALGGLYDTPHGVANSMLLPFVFEYNIPSDIEKHAKVAQLLGASRAGKSAEELAYDGVRVLKELANQVGIPKMKDLEYVNPDDFPYLAAEAAQNVSTTSNPRDASEQDYLSLFYRAYND